MNYELQNTCISSNYKLQNKKYEIQNTYSKLGAKNTRYVLQIYGGRTTLYQIRTPNKELEILKTKYNSPNYELWNMKSHVRNKKYEIHYSELRTAKYMSSHYELRSLKYEIRSPNYDLRTPNYDSRNKWQGLRRLRNEFLNRRAGQTGSGLRSSAQVDRFGAEGNDKWSAPCCVVVEERRLASFLAEEEEVKTMAGENLREIACVAQQRVNDAVSHVVFDPLLELIWTASSTVRLLPFL